MEQLLSESLRVANLPFTILLGVATGYWLTVILGVFHLDSLDFHFHFDLDGALASLLTFLRIKTVPVSVWLSIFAVTSWAIAVNVNHALDQVLPVSGGEVLRLLLGLPIFGAAGALCCSVIARMVEPAFKASAEARRTIKNVVGMSCTVTSSEVTEEFGTAEVRTDGAPLLINVRARKTEALRQGDAAKVYQRDEQENIFHITKAS